ncbi:ATPase [Vibrio jasicida]|uniref:ATPase n=1 Tax=Vibrio jasicida TaxID=766224 RepID=UPI000A5432E0|nr:ATPase [Vibrio jasicida]
MTTMMNKFKWILLLVTLPAFANIQCDHASWNDNLTQFSRLESNYNEHARLFNENLKEYNDSQMYSQTFSTDELSKLWRTPSNKNRLKKQLLESEEQREDFIEMSRAINALMHRSQTIAENWKRIVFYCQKEGAKSNEITANWYLTNTLEMQNDFRILAGKYLTLANQYGMEIDAINYARNSSE